MITEQDFTILGAGIIGLSQALFLLKNGFRVTIIDKHAHPDMALELNPLIFDTRVFALTPQTSAFLQSLEVWESIINQRACPYQHMVVWDGKGGGQITFDAPSLGVVTLGHIVEQSVILQALLIQAKQYISLGQLTWVVQTPTELIRDNEQKIGVKLADNTLISSKLLIGADGANSWVRVAAGLSVKTNTYHQMAIVATIESQHPHGYTAYQRFAEGGPLALLPLPHQNKLSIVWTQPIEISQALMALPEAAFNQKLSHCSESILGELSLVSTRKSFVLKNLQAQSYGSNRIVLIGDSAHVIHPLAGLGANLGFQDVITLGALILKQSSRQRDVGSNHLIQRYYRERIGKNEAIRHSMTVLNKLFASTHPIVKLLRNWGLDNVNALPGLKKFFANQAMGLS